VAHAGQGHYGANRSEDFRNQPVGGVKVVRPDEFPYLGKIETGFRV
jgi:hypothetical protein